MDAVLFVLQVLFMVPMIVRVAAPGRSGATIGHELAASLRAPGLLLHEIGLLVVWIGFGVRFWTIGIARAVDARGVVSCVLLSVATGLMFWSFAALRSWRLLPTIETDHELCATGPYALTRNPIYLAFDLLGLGIAVVVPTPFVILGAVLLIVGGEMRSRAEERALAGAFGARYHDYARRVARLIPGVY